MTKVTAQMSMSLDGFYTGPRDATDPENMSGWMQGPEAPGFFRITRWAVDAAGWRERQGFAGGERSVNSEIIEETFAAAGAYVMGRRMFDAGEIPWGDEPPFRAPVFVHAHGATAALRWQEESVAQLSASASASAQGRSGWAFRHASTWRCSTCARSSNSIGAKTT